MGYKRKRTSDTKTVVLDKTYSGKTYKVKNKKAVKVKKIKAVKVGKALKAKIMKVIEKKEDMIKGSWTDTYIGGSMYAASRIQACFNGCGVVPVDLKTNNGWHFTLPMFYEVASVLFGGRALQRDFQLRYQLDIDTVTEFKSRNLMLEIADSWSVYKFKNNTQHMVTIDLLIGVPKQRAACVEWVGTQNVQLGSDTLSAADLEYIPPLLNAWQISLDQDTAYGYSLPGYSPLGQGLYNVSALQNPNIQDIGRRPDYTKNLQNYYKIETVTLVLQPGQEVNHRLQGPRKQTIDFGKCFKNGVFMNVQKFSRNVAAIVVNSPNAIANFGATPPLQPEGLYGAVNGRFSDQIDAQDAGFTIAVERKDHFSIVMPEQTGFTYQANQAAGVNQFLNKRVPKHIYNIFDKQASTLPDTYVKNVVDLSVMNPQQPVKAGNGTGT